MQAAMDNVLKMEEAKEARSPVPALPKAFRILDLVAREGGIGFAAIQKRLDLPKSTTHQLLAALCDIGALQTTPEGGYLLGLKLCEYGAIAADQRTIERVALPYLEALSQEIGMTCHLGVLEGSDPIYLAKVEPNFEIRINTWVGKRLSLYRSSLGKVLLAWSPPALRDELIAQIDWVAKTPKSLRNAEELHQHLAGVFQRGWAFDDEEDIPNVRCIAAPVFDRKGKVIGAISAVGTVLQIQPDDFPRLARRLCAVAGQISRNL